MHETELTQTKENLVVQLDGPISYTSIHVATAYSVHGLHRKFQYFTEFVFYLFTRFSGYWAFFLCSCYSILQCFNLFSGVELSVQGRFVLSQ